MMNKHYRKTSILQDSAFNPSAQADELLKDSRINEPTNKTLPEIFTAIKNAYSRNCKWGYQFNSWSCTNLIRAVRNYGISRNEFTYSNTNILYDLLEQYAPNFEPIGISKTLLALSQMGFLWTDFPEPLTKKLITNINKNIMRFDLKDIIITLNALDKMLKNTSSIDLKQTIQKSIIQYCKINTLTPKDTAHTLVAFDIMKIALPADLKLMLTKAITKYINPSRKYKFNTRETANVMLALARTKDLYATDIWVAFINHTLSLIKEFNTLQLEQLSHAITCINARYHPIDPIFQEQLDNLTHDIQINSPATTEDTSTQIGYNTNHYIYSLKNNPCLNNTNNEQLKYIDSFSLDDYLSEKKLHIIKTDTPSGKNSPKKSPKPIPEGFTVVKIRYKLWNKCTNDYERKNLIQRQLDYQNNYPSLREVYSKHSIFADKRTPAAKRTLATIDPNKKTNSKHVKAVKSI